MNGTKVFPAGCSPDAAGEKRRVALLSVLAAIVLTGLKLGVGLWTNSLGLLAEAMHSGLDLAAALITLWAVSISAKPADRNHTYGHGKFENLSALIQMLLLLVTCAWIIHEAAERLFTRPAVEVRANIWAFLVVIVSMAVDYGRAKSLGHAARKHNSQALEADALHFTTDIWSSAVVLVGLLGVWFSERLGLAVLVKADAVAALAVAVIVIGVGFKLGRKSLFDLLDTVPKDLQDRVRQAVERVPGVEQVEQVRLRRSGAELFADVTLRVWQKEEFSKAHEIAHLAEAAICKMLPGIDVVVHAEPTAERDAEKGAEG